MDNLAAKWRPHSLDEVVEQDVVVSIVKNICESKEITNRNFLFIGPAGCGKANTLYTKIFTPNGYKLMKDIQIGDEVFTGQGNIGKVSGIYPQGVKPVYRIKLVDGTHIDVSDEHLNVFYTLDDNENRTDYCSTTLDLIKFKNSHENECLYIDSPILKYEEKEVPIDPNIIGFLLGNITVSSNLRDIDICNICLIVPTYINDMLTEQFDCKFVPNGWGYHLTPLHMHSEKFHQFKYTLADFLVDGKLTNIPRIYMENSVEQRLKLLRGIIAGHHYKPDDYGNFDIEIVNLEELSQLTAILIRSLGMVDVVLADNKDDITRYYHNILQDSRRFIESIEQIDDAECQCIMIDHPDHTYVCEYGLIPTHNTTTARIIANALNDNKGSIIEIDAASHSGVDSMREIMAQAKTYPVGSKYKVFIIDECFAADTKIAVKADNRDLTIQKNISEIAPGTVVRTLAGDSAVKQVFANKVHKDRLIYVKLSTGERIWTTLDHLFFTKRGWVKASELEIYTELYSEGITYSIMENAMRDIDSLRVISKGNGAELNIIENGSSAAVKSQPKLIIDEEGNHWDRFEQEIALVEYSNNLPRFQVTVESVLMYVSGLNQDLFELKFPELEEGDYVTLYDLEIEGHPSYFANDVLVHNCHAFSQAAWQSALLTIESQPAMSIFCWCVAGDGIVLTTSGPKRLDSLSVDEYVFDGHSYNKVLNVFDKGIKSCVRIKFNDGSYIECTPDHQIEMLGQDGQFKWVKAQDINVNDKCLSYTKDSETVSIILVSVSSIDKIGEKHVYDIEVANSHKFLYNNHIVHNCTTNPEKIPATILSRVQTFQLSKISLDGIYNRLKYIIEQENKEGAGITYDDDAILFLAKTACGGMRNGITALDKALMFDKHITIKSLEKSLGLPNYDEYFDMLNAIAKKDNESIIRIINSVYNSGVNFIKWFDGFFSFITNIVKYIYMKDINATMIPSIYADKISKYNSAHAALCLKLSNKLVKMNQELKTTQYLQELAISYLCTAPVTKK